LATVTVLHPIPAAPSRAWGGGYGPKTYFMQCNKFGEI
jgi:hypothetical protein